MSDVGGGTCHLSGYPPNGWLALLRDSRPAGDTWAPCPVSPIVAPGPVDRGGPGNLRAIGPKRLAQERPLDLRGRKGSPSRFCTCLYCGGWELRPGTRRFENCASPRDRSYVWARLSVERHLRGWVCVFLWSNEAGPAGHLSAFQWVGRTTGRHTHPFPSRLSFP